MTNETLAEYANLSLYSAMAVFTLAMLCHAAYLAGLLPARDRTAPDRELVAAGASTSTTRAASGERGAGATDDDVPLRARKAAGVASTTTWLGGLLLLACVVLRGLSVHRWPLGNMFEFAVMGSMFTVLAYSLWSTRRDLRWLGLFVTAPVLLVLGMALRVWYTEAAQVMPSLQSYWLVIHVTVAVLATAVFTIGAAATGIYLVKDAVQRAGRTSVLDRFPETGAIERTAYGLHIVAFPLWTFTLIAGAIWARQAWASYWNWDPKEVWTFVIWVVYAAYLHSRATSGISRQTASYIALAGYACVIVNFAVVNVFFVGQHSYSGL
ncbi:c-type cytochrome biogenesis protein CcsB [Pedococcus sp. 5OH_020]|uniref:c-type cytochrome biogenesis protein CcsB n=1 Tax=Pedococcus sp. 5OH_020 TaxID=2989814 RepID=UPI0022E9EDE4|nr:c-type cytochrome biogenesis protein CcsB [Pedococcus sp. 5OH_020]